MTDPAPLREAIALKLIDTLKPFAEVAEKLRHCHVVEICEPHPDNPSPNIVPMPREWFERAADDLVDIVIDLHGAGVLSEGQASKLTGLDRVEVRKLTDAALPTDAVQPEEGPYSAPVGSFLERLVAELKRRGIQHDYIQACYARGTGGFSEDILIPWLADHLDAVQPVGGVDREAIARLVQGGDGWSYDGDRVDEESLAAADAILALYATAPTAGSGWVMVPREPTGAMVDAGRDAAQSANAHFASWADEASSVWSAMITAAPTVGDE